MTQKAVQRPLSLQSLEALRIIAAVAVVLAHSGYLTIPFLQSFLGGSVFLGSIGVDIFFVISGFVMGISSGKAGSGLAAAKSFVIGRFLRLFPLYILCTLGAAAVQIAIHKPVDPAYLIQSIALLPTSDGQHFTDPVLFLGWTLRFEFYFYLLVAAGIAVNRKVALPVAGILVSFAAWAWFGYYYGAPLVLEFIAGFLLSILHKALIDDVRQSVGRKPLLAGLAVSVALVLLASTGHDWGGMDRGVYTAFDKLWIVYGDTEMPRIIVWGVPSLLLVWSCLCLEHDLRWRLAPLGKYTYSVYLLQFFVFIACAKLHKMGILPDLLTFLVQLVLLAVLSYASFHYVEEPLFKLRHRFGPAKRPMSAPVTTR